MMQAKVQILVRANFFHVIFYKIGPRLEVGGRTGEKSGEVLGSFFQVQAQVGGRRSEGGEG